mgnify:CR=1 FL=1
MSTFFVIYLVATALVFLASWFISYHLFIEFVENKDTKIKIITIIYSFFIACIAATFWPLFLAIITLITFF